MSGCDMHIVGEDCLVSNKTDQKCRFMYTYTLMSRFASDDKIRRDSLDDSLVQCVLHCQEIYTPIHHRNNHQPHHRPYP